VKLMAQEGVNFVTNAWIGKTHPTAKLQSDFDAIVLCGGATAARDLQVEGRNLKGVHFAMEFLLKSCKSLLDSNFADKQFIDAKGKNVIVIGGGDTGTDCVGTSLRHGCKSLVQFEILPRPPTTRAVDNPWPQWPRIYKLDYGQEEAAALFGADPRSYVTVTKRIVGDAGGNVKELHTVEVEWAKNGDGRVSMKEKAGSERVWPAELVLLAMGFVGPEKEGLLGDLGVKLDGRGNVAVDANKATSVQGVFAAGDMSRGQSLIVWAIQEGRAAARGVDQFLMGETLLP
jgi:glutamate synthase (NADPH) small chain